MTMPIPPAVLPNASATRAIFSAATPGLNRLTAIAETMSARNALILSTTIMMTTEMIPTPRMTSGLSSNTEVSQFPPNTMRVSNSIYCVHLEHHISRLAAFELSPGALSNHYML